jgi:hypothetical protein
MLEMSNYEKGNWEILCMLFLKKVFFLFDWQFILYYIIKFPQGILWGKNKKKKWDASSSVFPTFQQSSYYSKEKTCIEHVPFLMKTATPFSHYETCLSLCSLLAATPHWTDLAFGQLNK